ncbi:MAG TPA: DUF2752 domain-containing protein [Edaphobacter sp.]|nr:DUF2752 domain-containing protein [Edaphobacter sp.]
MSTSDHSGMAKIVRAAVPLVLTALCAAVLFLFPPEKYSFYPQCPIYRLLHVQCPGCGTTRALAALLHGHIAEALRFNALTTLLMPLAAVYAIFCYCRFVQRKPLRLPQLPAASLPSMLTLAILFAILRNLKHL